MPSSETKEIKYAVVVTTQFEGIHRWPECPFDDVSFLRNPHRHMFHIKMSKVVTHADRDIEIIMLKRALEDWWYEVFPNGDMDFWSCEMVAEALLTKFNALNVEVLEDGENGAYVWKGQRNEGLVFPH